MPKLFTKKWIFSFLVSFFITFITGFLIWNIFISPEDGVLNQILLGLKIFPASVSSDYVIENITPETDSGQEDSNNQDLESDENLSVIQNSVIASPQSFQDQLDDIQEKLDIISQQLQELVAQQNDKLADENKILDEEPDDENDQDDDQNEDIVIYPKILISEVQIAGISDDKQEFVELYNPNNQDVDLTDWYLQRKTAGALSGSSSWSTYVSNNLFFGKKIYANGYLLIARTGYYSNLADIFTDNPVTNDNSFALKNPNGDISDELGFGNSSDAELSATQNPVNGQSIGRKVLSDGTEEETDNNSNDFEIDNPTPKAQNIAYTAPISGDGGEGSVTYHKILISEVQILPIEQRFVELYNPNPADVNLNGWYLQRKTKSTAPADPWSSFISSSKFAGKIIPAGGYFLISKQIINSDILLDLTLSDDNSLVLKNPNRDISDKLGFGNAQDFENVPAQNPDAGQSIGRKTLETDTDNNSADFEIDEPTPRAQNIAYVEPPPVLLKNILISEIQIAGTTNVKDDWVELYNPNDSEFSLKGWSIQKSGWGAGGCSVDTSFYSKHFNNDAVIPPKGFYLIVSTNAKDSLKALATSPTGMTIGWSLTDNNTIYLVKNIDDVTDYNDSDIVDEVGLGEDACSPEKFKAICSGSGECPLPSQSVGRKVLSDGTEQDTDDNSADFEIDTPTPKAQNIAFIPSDTTAPIITLTGASDITINVGDTYIDAGATALDDIDGDITANITVINLVDVNTIGDYTITYNVSDVAGNHAVEVMRTIHIIAVPPASNDATVTSATYLVSSLTGQAGTIINIPFGTSKATFEAALIKNQSDQTWDDFGITDPVTTGNTLVVTAQDGITIATYTVTIMAPTNSATQLKITTSPQTISAGNYSGVFNVQSQNSSGVSTNVSATTHITLSADSSTGQFSNANATSCTGSFIATPLILTMSANTANKHFCYKDSTSGTFTITVSASAAGLSSDFQTVIVNP